MQSTYTTIVIFLFTGISLCNGQKVASYEIPAGTRFDEAVPFSERNLFPEFRRCQISYIDGHLGAAMANYNLLQEKVMLINLKKDTVFLNADYNIKQIDFGDTILVNDEKFGFIQTNQGDKYPKLGMKSSITIAIIDKVANNGYGSTTDATGSAPSTRRSSYRNGPYIDSQLTDSNRKAIKKTMYFFFDQNKRLWTARSSNIYKTAPSKREQIRDFIKSNQIDFAQKADLQKLMQYCQELAGD